MRSYKVRAALAAEIAGIDLQRFNEAVAEGFYPTAPKTVQGKARVFDVNGVVALHVYGLLLEEGVFPRKAGPIASDLDVLLKVSPTLNRVVHVVTTLGTPKWQDFETFDMNADLYSGLTIRSVRVWPLAGLRSKIIEQIEDDLFTAGNDE